MTAWSCRYRSWQVTARLGGQQDMAPGGTVGSIQFAKVEHGGEIAIRELSQNEGPALVHFSTATAAMELLDEERMYAQMLQTLGGAGRLILFDKPGLGASDPFDEDCDYLEQLREAYLAVLDELEVEAAWLFGGGGLPTACLAAMLARQQPDRLLGAVLVDPVGRVPMDIKPRDALERDRPDAASGARRVVGSDLPDADTVTIEGTDRLPQGLDAGSSPSRPSPSSRVEPPRGRSNGRWWRSCSLTLSTRRAGPQRPGTPRGAPCSINTSYCSVVPWNAIGEPWSSTAATERWRPSHRRPWRSRRPPTC